MRDPAIEEIRAVRHQISAECGHDTKRLLAYYREIQQKLPNRIPSKMANDTPNEMEREETALNTPSNP